MKSAPAIVEMEVVNDHMLKVTFENMKPRYVNLTSFPLLGIAKKLLSNEKFLRRRLIRGDFRNSRPYRV